VVALGDFNMPMASVPEVEGNFDVDFVDRDSIDDEGFDAATTGISGRVLRIIRFAKQFNQLPLSNDKQAFVEAGALALWFLMPNGLFPHAPSDPAPESVFAASGARDL
jgi:hypothetical protein